MQYFLIDSLHTLAISQCRGVQPVTVTAGTLEASRPVGTFTAPSFRAFININTILGINQLIPSLTPTRVTAVSICTQLVAYVWFLTFINIYIQKHKQDCRHTVY